MEKFDSSQLLKASFAGVPFYMEKQQETRSMKVVKHKLLDVEGLIIKPRGLGERIVKIPAYIVGADYLFKLKQFNEAAQAKKVGQLILPFDVNETAACESVEIIQEFNRLGAAFLEISFVIGKEAQAIKVELDNSFDFSLTSKKVEENSILKFLKKFSVEGFDSKQLKDLNNKLGEIKGLAANGERFDFKEMFSQPNNLVSTIKSLASNFKDYNYSSGTDKVSVQMNNIAELAKSENIVNESKKVETVKSVNDAIKLQDTVISQVKEQLNYLEQSEQISLKDDDSYLILQEFKKVFISYNRQLSITLPELTKYTNTIVRPTVLVAYDIADGDVDKLEQIEADIIARNNIKNTSLVPNQELEVLNV